MPAQAAPAVFPPMPAQAVPAVLFRLPMPEESNLSVELHTSRPHHMKPEKVLQEFQEAIRADEVLASPIYTRSGPRPLIMEMHGLLREAVDGLVADGEPPRLWNADYWAESIPATPTSSATPRRQTFPHTRIFQQPSTAESQLSQPSAAGHMEDNAEIVSITLDYEDYDWVTSNPERTKRWVQFHKKAVCRLLDTDERRIQVLDLQRGSIKLIIRVLPVSAVPELIGVDKRSVKARFFPKRWSCFVISSA
jgi:hypothetical protein